MQFFRWKCLKLTPKMTKIPKFFNFQRFHAFFPNFRQTLWIGTLKRVNKDGICCSVGFSGKFYAVFRWKCLKLTPKMTKNSKFFNFQRFHAFFPNFRQTLWIGTLKRVNKDGICCSVGFSGKFYAVFRWKCLKLTPKMTKNSKLLKFQIFSHFLFVSIDLVDRNVLNGGCPVVFYEEIFAMFWMKMSQIDTQTCFSKII